MRPVKTTGKPGFHHHHGSYPAQQVLGNAVRHARLQGDSLQGIARELGISRNTVGRYVDGLAPPVNRTPRRVDGSATQHRANGHCILGYMGPFLYMRGSGCGRPTGHWST